MTFYDDFATHYDKIFPYQEKTATFLTRILPAGKVLDIACGTGAYARELARRGREVHAVDLDAAMIREAKVRDTDKRVAYRTGDMQDIKERGIYDGIACIGNSLVHLPDATSIEETLTRWHAALKDEGELVIQIINYDRILNQNEIGLPTIEREGYRFERRYEQGGSHIWFDTTLITPDEKRYDNRVKLTPIRPNNLVAILRRVGFNSIAVYGGFDASAFVKETSIPLVLQASKHAQKTEPQTYRFLDDANEKSTAAKAVITQLPSWFGIESANDEYIKNVATIPVAVCEIDKHVVGFMAYRPTSDAAVELYVTGVLEAYHRRGIGKHLLRMTELHAVQNGYQYYTVKTLDPSRENTDYAKTRMFYEQNGFVKLETFKTLWDLSNPCLMMIKPL